MGTTEKSGMVTGAAQGIGKAIVLRRMKDGYGLSLLDILETELAHEPAPSHIRVNAVYPSGTLTPMAETFRNPEEIEEAACSFPLGRFAEVEDMAAGVAFLASENAAYITGVSLDINDGTLMI
jgi:NAD(P)-dependent dehydrogenase (short-subunit alcohol dehydrogenase family)